MGVDVNYCRSAYPLKNKLSKNIAIDIGANIGGFSMAYHNVFNKILYFEANPKTYKITKENLKNYSNVEGFNLGVSDVSGKKIKLMNHFNKHNGSVTCSPAITKNGHKEWVEVIGETNTISLEDILNMINNERINYLKMDCENSEYEILLNKDLSKIDYIAMELHWQMGKEKYNELLEYLTKTFNIEGRTSFIEGSNTMVYLTNKNI